MSDENVVRFGAPTLAGIKTGSLFTCEFGSREELLCQARDYDRLLAPRGLRLLVLRFSEKRALIYLYRPSLLERDLAAPATRRLLREAGYAQLHPAGCLRELVRRLRTGRSFPHEIGLFLGYPPEDVEGFIRTRGGKGKCVGCWKVYGDETTARERFAAFDRCTESYCRRCAQGVPLGRLAVSIGEKTEKERNIAV